MAKRRVSLIFSALTLISRRPTCETSWAVWLNISQHSPSPLRLLLMVVSSFFSMKESRTLITASKAKSLTLSAVRRSQQLDPIGGARRSIYDTKAAKGQKNLGSRQGKYYLKKRVIYSLTVKIELTHTEYFLLDGARRYTVSRKSLGIHGIPRPTRWPT